MRTLAPERDPGPRAGPAAAVAAPAANMGKFRAVREPYAPPVLGKKRGRDDDDDNYFDRRSGKITKKGSDPGAAARLFDTQQNLYAMEYMRFGDVRSMLT